MKLHLWGTDFRRSTSEFRRHLYIAPENRVAALRELVSFGFEDLVYLSTCNRVEFYTTGEDFFKDTRPMWRALLNFFGLKDEDLYRGYHLEGKSALRHLMRVGSSLESLVVGEPQVLGQLKEAVQWNKDNGLPVSRTLERCFQTVFETAKKIRTQTQLAEKSVSIANLGIKEIERHEAEFPLKSVVVVGRSPMSTTVIQWLKKNHSAVPILWVNRSVEKLTAFEEDAGLKKATLASFLEGPTDFSHLVTATSSAESVFTANFFDKLSKSPKILFDFAEPPDIDVNAVPRCHMKLVHIEDLHNLARENAESRTLAVFAAEKMIDEAIREYCLEQKETPILRSFSEVKPALLNELQLALDTIEKEFPKEVQPKVIRLMEKVIKRNLHQSRDHLRQILRKSPTGEEVTIV